MIQTLLVETTENDAEAILAAAPKEALSRWDELTQGVVTVCHFFPLRPLPPLPSPFGVLLAPGVLLKPCVLRFC